MGEGGKTKGGDDTITENASTEQVGAKKLAGSEGSGMLRGEKSRGHLSGGAKEKYPSKL